MEKVPVLHVKRIGLFSIFLSVKGLMVVCSLTGLLASNIAAVLHAGYYDFLYTGIRKALLAIDEGTANAVTRTSKAVEVNDRVRRETAELHKQIHDAHARRTKAEADLDVERAKVKQAHLDLGDVKAKRIIDAKEAKIVASRVRERLAVGVARNVGSVPAQSVPYLGIGVIVSMTAMDLYDACLTMKEFNDLLLKLGQGVESDNAVCGMNVPTKERVVTDLGKTWRKSFDLAKNAAEGAKEQVRFPHLQLPNTMELKSVLCPIIPKVAGC